MRWYKPRSQGSPAPRAAGEAVAAGIVAQHRAIGQLFHDAGLSADTHHLPSVFFLAGQPSADVLKYTYEDFKKGASDTYVTYLIRIEEKGRSPGLSEVLNYEIDVGNQSTTLGYYNGRLEPLGSYR